MSAAKVNVYGMLVERSLTELKREWLLERPNINSTPPVEVLNQEEVYILYRKILRAFKFEPSTMPWNTIVGEDGRLRPREKGE